ncbi:helix-turn-helix domain-containing protein [Edaphovirga cremea]|uniref:helix-turn-helix domain-containing protein n=1 Tax=Edaphovirga cremea TaxID=2267246 RepID=UPI003989863E
MDINNSHDIANLTQEILTSLGYTTNSTPHQLTDRQAAQALGVKPSTLAVWRSTGRYRLPYTKVGRLVRYRVHDLAVFLANRVIHHTGEKI